ncbi:MAG: cytochrome c biogenesis protein CcsA [Verrucomicrobia bacterium]|nr:cytochrome c biogenesis protein CcsA [Verrucomicrobiota bacterium]
MNWSDRLWVELALTSYLTGFGYSVYSLATEKFLTPRVTFWAICAGFLFTTVYLFDRGHAIGRCPITNRFEVMVFMTWSMVLIYLVIGSAYRLSLMGAFTAPVASALLFFAFTLSPGESVVRRIKVNPWLEAHTSFSMVACGAFALACIAGVMFLVQERQLKTRQPSSIFYRLPPITALSIVNSRLLWLGFSLFTVGLATGFLIGGRINWVQAAWSFLVWCVYGGILTARVRHAMAAKWLAALSIVAFSLLLSTFWGIRFISDRPSL